MLHFDNFWEKEKFTVETESILLFLLSVEDSWTIDFGSRRQQEGTSAQTKGFPFQTLEGAKGLSNDAVLSFFLYIFSYLNFAISTGLM